MHTESVLEDATSENSENQNQICLFSFSVGRFLAALILVGVGLLNYYFLGFSIKHPGEELIGSYNNQGMMIFLGGISSGIMVGTPPLLMGITLLVSTVYRMQQIKIAQSTDGVQIQQHHGLFKQTYNLSFEDIRSVKYQNTHLGSKQIWIVLNVPIIFLLLRGGLVLFNTNMAADDILPIGMVTTAGILLILSLLLTFFAPKYFTIETTDFFYHLWISPVNRRKSKQISEVLSKLFEVKDTTPILKPNQYLTIFGSLFTIIGIVSFLGQILFFSISAIFTTIIGILLLIRLFYRASANSNIKFLEKFELSYYPTQKGSQSRERDEKRKSFLLIILEILFIGSVLYSWVISSIFAEWNLSGVVLDQVMEIGFFVVMVLGLKKLNI